MVVALVAYSAILKGIYDNPAKRDHAIMEPYRGPDADARLAVLAELASELDITPGRLVIAWLLHQTAPTPVIVVALSMCRAHSYDGAQPTVRLSPPIQFPPESLRHVPHDRRMLSGRAESCITAEIEVDAWVRKL